MRLAWVGSNQQPPGSEPGTLPIELHAIRASPGNRTPLACLVSRDIATMLVRRVLLLSLQNPADDPASLHLTVT